MKILMIGSKGFLGSNLFNYFSQKHKVYGCDILNDKNKNYFQVIKTNPDYSQIFKENKFDLCINASGSSNIQLSLTNPNLDYTLNVDNVKKILDSIKDYNPECKLLQISSAAVYGNPDSLPIKENSSKKPISIYGKNKLIAEQLCNKYAKKHNIKITIVRPFSIYGPGLRKQIFWDLHQRSKQGEINIYGTGNESRDFIYISDFINSMNLIVSKGLFKEEIYNIANGDEIFIKDAVKTFFKNRDIKYNFTGLIKIGDPINWKSDISKIQSLGYKTQINIKEGINNYLEWLKKLK
jgi:UDP-glucose 4-epimerase